MNRRRRLEISAEGVAADWARLEDCLYFLQDLLMRGRGARGAPGGDRVELRDRVAQGIVLPFLYGSVLDTLGEILPLMFSPEQCLIPPSALSGWRARVSSGESDSSPSPQRCRGPVEDRG